MKRLAVFRLAVPALLLTLLGCSPSYYQQGLRSASDGQYSQASDQFYQEIKENPSNAKAWRELGVTFYQAKDFAKALSALQEADKIQPDARTQLFMGLIHEQAGDFPQALQSYREAIILNPRGDTKKKLRAHLDHLVRQQIQQEIQAAMALEENLQVDAIPDNTICVAGFDLPDDLSFLGSGLVEFTAIDLGKVNSLQVVERRKISELLKEMQIQQTDLVDPGTRLRVGKLVGSRNIVTGSMQLFEDQNIELHGASYDVVDATTSFTGPSAGNLEGFFRVQKAFVFRLIDSLGIVLTPEERSAIEEVPTESYLALMAYCKGMDHLDHGDYGLAADEFQVAADNDKSFTEAQVQAEVVGDIAAISAVYDGGSYTVIEAAAVNLKLDVVEQKFLSVLLNNSGFLPADLLGGSLSETANLPDTGSVTAVSVTVRGEINVPQ